MTWVAGGLSLLSLLPPPPPPSPLFCSDRRQAMDFYRKLQGSSGIPPSPSADQNPIGLSLGGSAFLGSLPSPLPLGAVSPSPLAGLSSSPSPLPGFSLPMPVPLPMDDTSKQQPVPASIVRSGGGATEVRCCVLIGSLPSPLSRFCSTGPSRLFSPRPPSRLPDR